VPALRLLRIDNGVLMSVHLIDLVIAREIATMTAGKMTSAERKQIVSACPEVKDVEQRLDAMQKRGWLRSYRNFGTLYYSLTDEGRTALDNEPLVARDKPGLTNR